MPIPARFMWPVRLRIGSCVIHQFVDRHLYAVARSPRLPMEYGKRSQPVLRIIAVVLLSPLAASTVFAQSLATVAVVAPTTAPVAEQLQLSGTLSAERSARLSPRVEGLVSRVRVDAGDTVRAGDALLELDATLARLALDRSRADTAQGRAQTDEAARLLAEGQRLAEQQHIPPTEVATRNAARTLAEAAQTARLAAEREQTEVVERHVLTAPFDGVIVRKLTEAGEWVTRGTPVLELVAIDRVRLDVQAPQERYRDIVEDAEVIVRPDTMPGLELPGRIAAWVPVAGDASARSFLVRILIEDAGHRLLPGTSATAVIRVQAERGRAALSIPRDALLRHPDGGFSVFTVEPGAEPQVKRRPVRVGREGNGMIEIVEGLPADRSVVVRGNEVLVDGQRVRVLSD